MNSMKIIDYLFLKNILYPMPGPSSFPVLYPVYRPLISLVKEFKDLKNPESPEQKKDSVKI
jgi:hypothetical protein